MNRVKKILLLLFLAQPGVAAAQTPPDLSGITLETEADYNARADEAALEAARFILSVTLAKENEQHAAAVLYLQKWMDGTPDYTFDVFTVANLTGRSQILMAVAFAGMTEYVLTHKSHRNDIDRISAVGLRKALAYAKDPKHKIKPDARFKAVLDAEAKGKLEEYVGSMRRP